MALSTKLLHLRPIPTPSTPLRFSTRPSSDRSSEIAPPPPSNPPNVDPKKSSFSSYFSDVKASLKQQPPPPHHRPYPKPSDPFSKISSLGEIQKNLSEFRRLSAPPPPPSKTPISFEELYKRDVIANPIQEKTRGLSLNTIRESLRNLQSKKPNDLLYKKNEVKVNLEGKYDSLPRSVFGKELDGIGGVEDGLKGGFFKYYSCEDLGKRLMELRPEKKKEGEKNWFSLRELSERLHKLRVIDEKEMQASPKSPYLEIRGSIAKLARSELEKKTNANVIGIDMLNNLGAKQDFMLLPPKEHLVEKYFHPDNMSSAEKLKIELKKVRDEFKMSESDCGSARVQVAQLTTKIKHLSTALHKKDKHSRKGLQAMVQLRKKLLKYLRRTDWDSYCMVLAKLGLRDNPDYKN